MKSLISSALLTSLLGATLALSTGCLVDGSSLDEGNDSQGDAVSTTPPFDLLQGVDSINGAGLNKILKGQAVHVNDVSTMDASLVDNTASLSKALGISGSIQAEFGLVGSLGGKADFAKSLSRSSHNVAYVVHVTNVSQKATDTATLSKADADWAKKNAGQFVKSYGDSYVSSVQTGGEFIAVYLLSADTVDQQKNLMAAINGSINFDAIKGTGELTAKIQNAASSQNTSWSLHVYVSGVSNPPPVDATNIFERAQDFFSGKNGMAVNAPSIVSVGVTSNDAIPNLDLSTLQKNRQYILSTQYGGPGNMLLDMNTIAAQIADLQKIYAFYNWTGDDATINLALKNVHADMDTLSAEMNVYEINPGANIAQYNRKHFASLTKGFPRLTVSAHHFGLGGGTGGKSFSDYPVGVEGYLKRLTRLGRIEMAADPNTTNGQGEVTQLFTRYLDVNHPQGLDWHTHGQNAGIKGALFTLDEGTFVNSVSTSADQFFTRYLQVCAEGFCTHTGVKSGNPHDFYVPKNSVVLGLSGNSGDRVDSLIVDYATFAPAKWTPAL